MGTPKRGEFSPEVRKRAIRLAQGQAGQYPSQWGAIRAIAPKLGVTKETFRR
jgi:transposase-like protein